MSIRSITAGTQEKLFRLCTDLGISEDNYREFRKIIEDENESMFNVTQTIERERRDLIKKVDNLKEVLKQQGERSKAKLMSVYYLLDALKKMGTHREKETAVRFLQQTVDDLVKGHNEMSWDQDLFEIPF